MSAAFCGALLVATPAAAMLQNDLQTEYTEVSTQGEQTNVESNWSDSKEVNTVQMSETARKMIQAEKAKNAAENDRFGGAITIIAMCIVLFALIVLSILFLFFGKISTAVMSNKKREAHGVTAETSEDHHDELDSGEVIAAIGMALAEHFGQGHDMEDTILTIKRMKRSYSPWNSKIYNMRQTPEVSSARRSLK
ncbi:MAG: OadG family protein [Muribaculaceae bacterium]|nr:OadG family protein [Muribaculaceae bacterium]